MSVIRAVFEKGVFRPRNNVDLPEGAEVLVETRPNRTSEEDAHLDRLYAIMKQSFDTGAPNLAARHNEPHP